MRDLTDGVGSIVAERAAVVAFAHLDDLRARGRAVLQRNLETFAAFLAATPALEWVPPDGGTVAFPRLRSRESADAIVDELVARHDTIVVPGRFFEAPAHVRVAVGIRPETLERGLAALAAVLR